MRRKSSNKDYDLFLKIHYKHCYEEAIELFKAKSTEERAALCKIKSDEARLKADNYDFKKKKTMEEVFCSDLDLNKAYAYIDAGRSLAKMGSIN